MLRPKNLVFRQFSSKALLLLAGMIDQPELYEKPGEVPCLFGEFMPGIETGRQECSQAGVG